MNLDHVAEAIWRAHRLPRADVHWDDVAPLAQRTYHRMARAAAHELGITDPAWTTP